MGSIASPSKKSSHQFLGVTGFFGTNGQHPYVRGFHIVRRLFDSAGLFKRKCLSVFAIFRVPKALTAKALAQILSFQVSRRNAQRGLGHANSNRMKASQSATATRGHNLSNKQLAHSSNTPS